MWGLSIVVTVGMLARIAYTFAAYNEGAALLGLATCHAVLWSSLLVDLATVVLSIVVCARRMGGDANLGPALHGDANLGPALHGGMVLASATIVLVVTSLDVIVANHGISRLEELAFLDELPAHTQHAVMMVGSALVVLAQVLILEIAVHQLRSRWVSSCSSSHVAHGLAGCLYGAAAMCALWSFGVVLFALNRSTDAQWVDMAGLVVLLLALAGVAVVVLRAPEYAQRMAQLLAMRDPYATGPASGV